LNDVKRKVSVKAGSHKDVAILLVGTGVLCQEHDCKQLCKMIGNSFASVSFMRLEAERSVAERDFQTRRAAHQGAKCGG
jgi:hypothetical protein